MDPDNEHFHFRQLLDLVKHARVTITLIMVACGVKMPARLPEILTKRFKRYVEWDTWQRGVDVRKEADSEDE